MNVLQQEGDYYDLAMAYLRRAAEQNVLHVEIFFDPQGHTDRGVAFRTVIDGLWAAMKDAERAFGISTALILSFLRHLDETAAERTLAEALPWRARFLGLGLDSSATERGRAPCRERGCQDVSLSVVAVYHKIKKKSYKT